MSSPAPGAAGASARGRRDRREAGKPGTKRHFVTTRAARPSRCACRTIGLRLTGANRHDRPEMTPTLDAVPRLRGRPGRLRRRPDKRHAEKAYDATVRRRQCRARGIVRRIPGKASGAARSLADIDGWSSGSMPGSTASAACPSDRSDAPAFPTPSHASPPASSHSTRSGGSGRLQDAGPARL